MDGRTAIKLSNKILGIDGPWIKYINSLKFIGIDVKKMLVSIENFKEDKAVLLEYIIDIKNRTDSLQTPLSDFRKHYNKKNRWMWKVSKVEIQPTQVYEKVIIPLLRFGIYVEDIKYKYNKINKEKDLLIFYIIHLRNAKKASLRVS